MLLFGTEFKKLSRSCSFFLTAFLNALSGFSVFILFLLSLKLGKMSVWFFSLLWKASGTLLRRLMFSSSSFLLVCINASRFCLRLEISASFLLVAFLALSNFFSIAKVSSVDL